MEKIKEKYKFYRAAGMDPYAVAGKWYFFY
mgnify:CR=1 FL=1